MKPVLRCCASISKQIRVHPVIRLSNQLLFWKPVAYFNRGGYPAVCGSGWVMTTRTSLYSYMPKNYLVFSTDFCGQHHVLKSRNVGNSTFRTKDPLSWSFNLDRIISLMCILSYLMSVYEVYGYLGSHRGKGNLFTPDNFLDLYVSPYWNGPLGVSNIVVATWDHGLSSYPRKAGFWDLSTLCSLRV